MAVKSLFIGIELALTTFSGYSLYKVLNELVP
jgi:hypothetical protein